MSQAPWAQRCWGNLEGRNPPSKPGWLLGLPRIQQRDLRKGGDLQPGANPRKACSQRALARTQAYIYLPSFPSHSLMCLTSPRVSLLGAPMLCSLCRRDRTKVQVPQKWLNCPSFRFSWNDMLLAWSYSNKCSTEAAWSFPVVSKLCTLQGSWAGPASPPFSRSLVPLCWPWPSWQWAHRRAWRWSLLLMCWEHSMEMKCRICTVPYTAVASSKLDSMEQVGLPRKCLQRQRGSAPLPVACSGCTVCIIIYFKPSLAKRQLWREGRSQFGHFWLPCAEMASSGTTGLICSPWGMAVSLFFYPICFGFSLF